MLKNRLEIEIDFLKFMDNLTEQLNEVNLGVDSYQLDHVCFRVENLDQYNEYKSLFSTFGKLIIESEINGRAISTFKLSKPLKYKNLKIEIIELPQPKKNNDYNLGFEHAEFVIIESFESFAKKYPHLNFDWSATNKTINPDLRFSLKENLSVKFHHQSLEDVIKFELDQVKEELL